MNRQAVRHDAELSLNKLTKVSLVFPDKHEIESIVVDISSQGLKVSISPSGIPLSVPRKNETVAVSFHAIRLQLTCRCIYTLYNQDGSMYMGLYVIDLNEQGRLREFLDGIE